MSEHLSEQSVEQYRRRKLAPMEILVVDDHLATCSECNQLLRSKEDVKVAFESLVGPPTGEVGSVEDHLSYEQLAATVDNELDDVGREIVSVHLEACPQCDTELQGLYALKETVPPPSAESRAAKPVTEREQLSSFWRRPGSWAWPRLATGALVVLVIGTLAWAIWTWPRRAEVVESTRPSVDSPSPAPSTVGSPFVDQQTQGRAQPNASPTSSPRIVVALNDGRQRVTLDDAGNLSGLAALPTSYHEAVKTALSSQRLNTSLTLKGLGVKGGVLMSSSAEGVAFALVNPIGTVVRSNRPAFRWRSLPGATSYVVKVFDTTFKEIATSSPQIGTTWKMTTPLARGSIYIWQVTAIKNDEEIKSPVAPAPEARFRVLARATATELAQAEKVYSNSHLTLGTIYAQAGLLDDAEREFRLLLSANPGSAVVQKLLQNVSLRR